MRERSAYPLRVALDSIFDRSASRSGLSSSTGMPGPGRLPWALKFRARASARFAEALQANARGARSAGSERAGSGARQRGLARGSSTRQLGAHFCACA